MRYILLVLTIFVSFPVLSGICDDIANGTVDKEAHRVFKEAVAHADRESHRVFREARVQTGSPAGFFQGKVALVLRAM